MIKIKTVTGIILYECDVKTLKECVEQAVKSGVCLDNADFKDADLESVDLKGVSLQWTNFEGANLSLSDLKGCNLSNTNLINTNCYGVNLNGAILRNSRIKSVNFSNASMRNIDFRSNLRIKTNDGFIQNSFVNTDLTSSLIDRLRFLQCDFSGAILSHTSIKYSYFQECNLNKVNLKGANIYKTSFGKCNLSQAIFRATNIFRTEFPESDILKADLGYAALPFSCGNISVKTSEYQRVRIAHYLLGWLEQADNLSEYEEKLKDFLKDYGSLDRFIEAQMEERKLSSKNS